MTYSYTTGTNPNENVVQADGVGPLPSDSRALPFNANFRTKVHEVWWVSENPLIYPGQFTVAGQWAAGDMAIVAVRWGTNSLGFAYTVQLNDTAFQIAQNLRNQMANDATFANTPIFCMEVGNYGGGASWQISPPYSTWTANPRIILSSGKISAHGTVVVALQPQNVLDTPACTHTYARVIPGRPAQAMDLIAEQRFMGQTTQIVGSSDANIRQIYVNVQAYIKNPSSSAPGGLIQYQVASPGSNGVVNLMQLSNDGVVFCDRNGQHPPGGAMGDGAMGAGSLSLPSGAAIYIGGTRVLST